jgi:hypothetical protein
MKLQRLHHDHLRRALHGRKPGIPTAAAPASLGPRLRFCAQPRGVRSSACTTIILVVIGANVSTLTASSR